MKTIIDTNFFKLNTVEDFFSGELSNIEVVNTGNNTASMQLEPCSTQGEFISEIYSTNYFKAIVLSFDCETPDETYIEIMARSYDNDVWSDWFSWGKFGQTISRGCTADSIDEFITEGCKIQIKALLFSNSAIATPKINLIACTFRNAHNYEVKENPTNVSIPVVAELGDCDKFSRLENNKEYVLLNGFPYCQGRRDVVSFVKDYPSIGGSICSMVTVTGQLNCKGEDILPEEVALSFRDFNYGFGNWVYSVAVAGEFGYESYVRYADIQLLKNELRNGYVVGIGVRYTNDLQKVTETKPFLHNATGSTNGHLILIRGFFTDINGDEWVFVNDSGFCDNKDENAFVSYRVDELLTGYYSNGKFIKPCWTSEISYIVHDKIYKRTTPPIKHINATLKIEQPKNSYNLAEYSVYVDGEKLNLPNGFTTCNNNDKFVTSCNDAKKCNNLSKGGIVALTFDYIDGRNSNGQICKSTANKHFEYGIVENSHIVFDDSLLKNSKCPMILTAYIIYNDGKTYIAKFIK